ncbi:hypothetical protein LXL04_008178 [Taraxacum kok-saghyz]
MLYIPKGSSEELPHCVGIHASGSRMLHSLMPISRMDNKCAFINPQEITEPRCEYDDEHGKVGGHWMLPVICPHQFKGYILDSVFGSKTLKSYKIVHHVNRAYTRFKKDKTNKASFSPTSWSFPKCNKQLDNWECGYYVMCWMHEFVLFRQHNFPQNNWKDNTPFFKCRLWLLWKLVEEVVMVAVSFS